MKKQTLVIAWVVAISIGITFTLIPLNIDADLFQFGSMENDGPPKAAIIDQLYSDIPNKNFQNKVTESLKNMGYEVDYYTTEEITVDFYKQLSNKNYGFIIFRGHSLGEGAIGKSATLFTGEKYDPHKYIQEQFTDHVGIGVPYLFQDLKGQGGQRALAEQSYFVIGSKFVDELMVGKFPDSTIILGGCDTAIKKHLSNSFLKRGASEVIGWDGLVDAGDNDKVILDLLDEIQTSDAQMFQIVDSVMKKHKGQLHVPVSLVYNYRND